jgi:hypothetical protein
MEQLTTSKALEILKRNGFSIITEKNHVTCDQVYFAYNRRLFSHGWLYAWSCEYDTRKDSPISLLKCVSEAGQVYESVEKLEEHIQHLEWEAKFK